MHLHALLRQSVILQILTGKANLRGFLNLLASLSPSLPTFKLFPVHQPSRLLVAARAAIDDFLVSS